MPGLEQLDLNLLRDLVELVDTRSVTEAGRRRGLTQSAMSHRLRRLRDGLGDVLLVPDPAGLVPTPRALELARAAREALQQLDDALRVPESFDATSSDRRFLVGTSDYGEFVVLPLVLRALRELAATVTVSVARRQPDPVAGLREGTLDLEIAPRGLDGAGVSARTIARDGFIVASRAAHPLAGKELDLEHYLSARHAQIAPGGRPGGPVDAILARSGHRRTIDLRVAHFVSAPFVVAETDLLLTGPELLLREASRHLDLHLWPVPFEVPPTDVQMYWHARQSGDPGHRWLRGFVAEVTATAFG